VSADPRVNSDEPADTNGSADDAAQTPRWWLRRPAAGIAAAMTLGVAALLVTTSIGAPGSEPGTAFTNLVVLPIALLLPAIALGAAMIAWHAFRHTRGRQRLLLTVPMSIALVCNVAAIIAFARWALQLVSP